MNSEFELIRYNDNLPARIETKQGKLKPPYHWHKEIELIFVLDGELQITVNNTDDTVHADELRLINGVTPFQLIRKRRKGEVIIHV